MNDSTRKNYHLQFHGKGGEYFKIWIVNLFLSILTLGIYSAWAKVRTHRYFYGNTELMGSTFEYHAKPIQILKGRILVFILFMIYVVVGSISPAINGMLTLLLFLAIPWIIVRSMRFRNINSSWRNIRFNFEKDYFSAIKTFLLWPMLILFTLGLIIPFLYFLQSRFFISLSSFGKERFQFTGGASGFYKIAFISIGIILLGLIPFILLSVQGGMLEEGVLNDGSKPEFGPAVIIAMVTYIVAFMVGTFLYKTLITNYVWCHIELAGNHFGSHLKLGKMMWIGLSNLILIVITVGIFTPWAMIRMTRYRVDCLTLRDSGNIEDIISGGTEYMNAIGDEAGEMFDIDIGAL